MSTLFWAIYGEIRLMMRNISLKSAGFFVLNAGFFMILLACVYEPVNLLSFTEDGKVQEIAKGLGTGVIGGMILEIDVVPELQWRAVGTTAQWKDLSKKDTMTADNTVTVSLHSYTAIPNKVTIKVSNSEKYDADSIIWHCNGVDIEYWETLVVTAGTAPFDTAKTYTLTVEGKIGGKPYSTYVFIMVVY